MSDFNASLVREKIVFIENGQEELLDDSGGGPTVVRSNRIFLSLKGRKNDKIVVRAQNMHSTLRFAARIMHDFFQNGSFTGREKPVEWEAVWQASLSAHEKDFNPNIWGAVYLNGKCVFRTTSSSFIDIIEQCALLATDNYDATMEITENVLKKVGKDMRITHSSNVAAIFTDEEGSMRCGIMHRASKSGTTFTFTAGGGSQDSRIVQTLGVAAAFLEAFNLGFILRDMQAKKGDRALEKDVAELKKFQSANARKATLVKTIKSYEELYDVKYRPDKPVLFDF